MCKQSVALHHAALTLFACCVTCALVGSGSSGAAVSEADFLDEVPVVLSASRLSQPVNDAPASVTVIDQDAIRDSGFRDIPDLLRLVPGFSVAYTRDNTWAVGYHGMADAFSRRFQVLVDGRSIYSAAYGAVLWNDLPLAIDDIERIEVVRGPNAAIYGANAFFAVINIVTKEAAQTPGGFVSAQHGEQGMSGVVARYGQSDGALRYRLTVSSQNRDRFETHSQDGQGRPDTLFEQTRTAFVNARVDYDVSSGDELSAQFGATLGDWQAGRLGQPLEPRQQDVTASYAQLKFRRANGPDDEWMLHFYYNRDRFQAPATLDLSPLPLVVDGGQGQFQTRTNLEFQSNNRLTSRARIVWGAEVRQETVQSPLYFSTADTLSGMLSRAYANLEWRVGPKWLVQGGAMLEHHYFSGNNLSPRIALNYEFAPGHTLRMNVSQAYRTPTFFEQDGHLVYRTTTGIPVDTIFVPSAGLRPERILSRELAYIGRYKPWHVQFDAKLFHDSVTDYIGNVTVRLAPSSEKATQFVNGGSFRSQGGELQLHWQLFNELNLSAQFARVFIAASADIPDDDVPLSAPRNNFSLLANYDFADGWHASVGVYRSGRMTWLSDGDITQAYTRWDARLARRWEWHGHPLEAAVVGQNLGKYYSEFRVENHFSQRVYGSLSIGW